MANVNHQGGHVKSRAQAKAWLRHNDRERRADPQTNHTNLDIDAELTAANFELGPTIGMSYADKCARLDGLLDAWGYGDDGTVCMTGRVVYPPDDVVDDPVRMRSWFEAAADVIVDRDGADNIVGMYVDMDEVHDYTDARTGEVKRAKPHMHVYAVPVVEAPVKPQRIPVYLTPEGRETTDETAAARVYRTACGGETDDPTAAVLDDDGEPVTCPRRARTKAGKVKRKKVPPADDAPVVKRLCGSDFSARARIIGLNDDLERMTRERFGISYNTGAARDPARRNKTVEELKAESAALEADVAALSDTLTRARDVLDAAETYDADTRAAADRYAIDTRSRADKDALAAIHTANVSADAIESAARAKAADIDARIDADLTEAARLTKAARARDAETPAPADTVDAFLAWLRRARPSVAQTIADLVHEYRIEHEQLDRDRIGYTADAIDRMVSRRRRIPDVPRAAGTGDGDGYGFC